MSRVRADENLSRAELGAPQSPAARSHRFFPVLCAGAALVAASAGALALLRHQGVGIGGDEPYYLVEAVSIGRFHTLDLNPGYAYAVTHHIIFPWKAHLGPHLAAQIGQGSPHYKDGLVLSGHAVGLSALLALPMLAGSHVAVAALIVILAALALGLAQLVGEIAEIESPWRIAIAGLVLAPAYLVATTQLYPDLISGLVIAIVIMVLALVERRGKISNRQVAVGSVLLTILPWFDAKYVFIVAVFLVAVLIVYFRTRFRTSQLAWFVLPPLIGVAGLVAFNSWGFGAPLGAYQPISLFGINTLTRFLALLFDRRQGLLVQFPVALLGIAGLWMSRRRNPVAALTTLTTVLAIAYGNATQVVSFGGGSMVGRFGWPVVPVLFGFAGLYLLELWKTRPSAVKALAVFIGALYALQAVPVVLDEHAYFNQLAWDPSRYSGWWPVGGLDPSPVLGYVGGVGPWLANVSDVLPVALKPPTSILGAIPTAHWWANGRTWFGLAWLVVTGAAFVSLLVALLGRPMRISRSVLGLLLALSVTTGIVALAAPVLLPAPTTFTASSFLSNAPTSGTSRVLTESAGLVSGPNWSLRPGTYQAIVRYRLLNGNGNATVSVLTTAAGSPARKATLQSKHLPTTGSSSHIEFTVRSPRRVTLRVLWAGSGSLEVTGVTLEKDGSA